MEPNETKRMYELEEKNKLYKLKRWEKKELKELHRKNGMQKKEEEKKRNIKKKKVLERQLNMRKNKKVKNNEKDLLEDMCILGSIMKEEIIQEKKTNPEKFISIEEATKKENEGNSTFCLGILAKNLENMGITTAIEKNPSNDTDSANTVLEFITNGMIDKKKYDFHFDLGDERNKELLNNKEEQEKFNNKLKKKLSLEYNIPEDKILITNPQKGSYSVQVIFQTDEFNDKNIDINKLKGNCSDNEFKELKNLKEVHSGLIMSGCKLSEEMLDPRGNRESGWGENEMRGGFKYIPPKGWKGYGLKVLDKYDAGNNDWLSYNGGPNEWAIAYHGIGTKGGFKVETATEYIFKGGFKVGKAQACKDHKNSNARYISDDPNNDHSQTVGIGIYCSPNPNVMKEYASYANQKANCNGKNYLMGFMMRVKPDKIRISSKNPDYWVLNATTDEMRPYRIMVKEC
jgi:hypothetical protein